MQYGKLKRPLSIALAAVTALEVFPIGTVDYAWEYTHSQVCLRKRVNFV